MVSVQLMLQLRRPSAGSHISTTRGAPVDTAAIAGNAVPARTTFHLDPRRSWLVSASRYM